MRKAILAVFVILAFTCAVGAGADNEIEALSAWTNQSGSTLYIDGIDSNGRLTGTYINRAPGYQCQNVPYPVTGWVYGTAVTFTTIWQSSSESCNSITAWTGFVYEGKIQTLWQLVINGSSNEGQIIKGADVSNLR